MFAKFRKPDASRPDAPVDVPGPAPEVEAEAPSRALMKAMPVKPAQAAPDDKERKRKERLPEIKLEIHKALLDNLNLAALEKASEQDLRNEIQNIAGESLEDMGFAVNRDERAQLVQDLYDEVKGLGPLEALLKDDTINDILVNGPQQIFVERAGKLQLTDVTFKDERHLLRIIDKIVSAVGRRVDESNP